MNNRTALYIDLGGLALSLAFAILIPTFAVTFVFMCLAFLTSIAHNAVAYELPGNNPLVILLWWQCVAFVVLAAIVAGGLLMGAL